ncbi:peptidyl-prolyl cis-trans isomerase [Candidatus Berkiella cookevillensis]|uniref:Peptidyl-prolyl cis-trans isomerase n=1 Tax=Candidatus Berkiella cookevillensis TaxID=437022 RepID=A0A0Q9YK90_9GAMM|nr:peptidylprolyl isomerase [Candidatus Berkiella cookevillensis]MCS5708771.1 peptidyl-prolyl cis-trans isomerase [Candidatus Berkiella cookevillensis]
MIILHTNLGDIHLELYPEKAPKTVQNFMQYAKDGFYNKTIFHRVIKGFMIQGGGFATDLDEKSPQNGKISNEAKNGLSNQKGSIAMARTSEPHSAQSQFFINLANNEFLDHKSESMEGWGYCVFGKVTQGMDIVELIGKAKTGSRGYHDDVPLEEITIDSVEVLDAQ